jgi:hypothetical protein
MLLAVTLWVFECRNNWNHIYAPEKKFPYKKELRQNCGGRMETLRIGATSFFVQIPYK